MKIFQAPALLLADPAACREALIESIQTRCLSLFVGAGISKSATGLFPTWSQLVETCCAEVGASFDATKANNNNYLLTVAESFKERCEATSIDYRDVVEKALYAAAGPYQKSTMKSDLLIALGALVMNSVKGRASVIVNYNYDDLLEWYLIHHGFNVKIISTYPDLILNNDVIVYHPHGFLPQQTKFKKLRTKQIVFTKRDYEEANSEDSPWNQFQRNHFGSNVALFVGMSGDDSHIQTLFANAYDKLVEKKRVIGFMILKDTPENRDLADEHMRRGLVHIYIKDHAELPEFLLDLCRSAVGL